MVSVLPAPGGAGRRSPRSSNAAPPVPRQGGRRSPLLLVIYFCSKHYHYYLLSEPICSTHVLYLFQVLPPTPEPEMKSKMAVTAAMTKQPGTSTPTLPETRLRNWGSTPWMLKIGQVPLSTRNGYHNIWSGSMLLVFSLLSTLRMSMMVTMPYGLLMVIPLALEMHAFSGVDTEALLVSGLQLQYQPVQV